MANFDGSFSSSRAMPTGGFTDKDGKVIKKKQHLQAQRKERKERQALLLAEKTKEVVKKKK